MLNHHGRISFWLIPAEEHKANYQLTINELAETHGTPKFEPHVTIFSAPFNNHDSYNQILKKAAQKNTPITLHSTDLDYSDKYTQSLFLTFKPSRKLSSLSKFIENLLSVKSNYQLKPHLSLLYSDTDLKKKGSIAKSIKIPKKRIVFTHLKAISTPSHIYSDKDIREWVEIASVPISSIKQNT